jgi:phytoene dehydrogenase-like protein
MVAGSCDWRDRKVRDWLLLLLRFAITRELADRSAVLAAADELDALGLRWRPANPSFFLRTSREVCDAILATRDRNDNEVLRTHVARIDDPRLRRAFRAAVGLQETVERPLRAPTTNRRSELWKGLG